MANGRGPWAIKGMKMELILIKSSWRFHVKYVKKLTSLRRLV